MGLFDFIGDLFGSNNEVELGLSHIESINDEVYIHAVNFEWGLGGEGTDIHLTNSLDIDENGDTICIYGAHITDGQAELPHEREAVYFDPYTGDFDHMAFNNEDGSWDNIGLNNDGFYLIDSDLSLIDPINPDY